MELVKDDFAIDFATLMQGCALHTSVEEFVLRFFKLHGQEFDKGHVWEVMKLLLYIISAGRKVLSSRNL